MLVNKLEFHLPPPIQWTEEEFFAFCEANSELRIEREANGNIVLMAPTGGSTGNRNSGLTARLWLWNDQAKLGYTFDSSTGFRLASGAMRSPDVAWVEKSRYEGLTDEQQAQFLPLAPDFVIELRSPSDPLVNLQKKLLEWIENGVQLAWLIDPKARRVSIFREDGSIEVKEADESAQVVLGGEKVLPGFEMTYPFKST
jgi:Uma2 family endonuclease